MTNHERLRWLLKYPMLRAVRLVVRDEEVLEAEKIKIRAKRLRRLADGPPNELDDLVKYLGMSESLVARNMARGADLVASRWMRENPQTQEEIRVFYQYCSEYVFLVAYHNLMIDRWRNLLRLFDDEAGCRCLTFGGGIGSEALKLTSQGNEVWYCDVPNSPVWRFAKWRADHASAAIHFTAAIPEDVQLDCVVALNVFQILSEEQLTSSLQQIAAGMKPGARLYCQNDFVGVKRQSSIEQNRGWLWDGRAAQHHDHTELWNSLMAELGLRKETEQVYTKEKQPVALVS